MIIGIGIDQIEVARLARKESDDAFVAKLFSSEEQEYCRARGIPAQHFAARFAAKEAFLKALGLGLNSGFELFEIAVLPDSHGKPVFQFSDAVQAHLDTMGARYVHVSLSHLKDIATAMVIIEK